MGCKKRMKNNTPETRADLIRHGKPVHAIGLTFYPVLVDDYEIYIDCADALKLRLASLPVRYTTLDFTSALFAVEIDRVKVDESVGGAFYRFIRLLYLSLRIVYEPSEVMGTILVRREEDHIRLAGLRVTQNGKTVTLSPSELSFEVRQLIAEQNGAELPDESVNIDLVRDYEELKKMNAQKEPQLNVSMPDLIASVAYLSHLRETDIYGWTVAEFERRVRAIDRDKLYMIYATAESSGFVTFKSGNPVPSWRYDPKDNNIFGTVSGKDMEAKLNGVQAKQ